MTTKKKLLEDSLLLIWNNRNENERLEKMKVVYAPDIHFYESHSSEAIVGHQAINELISKLQHEWPSNFEFELNKPSEMNHHTQIISWRLGVKEAESITEGIDIAVIENGLIKELFLFLETR